MRTTRIHQLAVPAWRALLVGPFLATLVVSASVATAADTDADGIDAGDNCPTVFNPLQDDCNADGQGDVCDVDAGQNDTDGDHVCQGVDKCTSVPNVDQRDCNNNGIGDLCEAATANRDDDFDGICNAVDSCPLEAVAVCGMQAITVPWVPANPNIPHPTYSGATHTLKGIARYGGNQYMWSFGDGTASTAWTAISDAYNLGVNHVYTGAVGQTFIATLSVRNSATPAVVSNATYRVKIGDSGALPAAAPYNMEPNKMDVRIDMAIDQGLWYLHTTMSRATYADGSPGYAQRYGQWNGSDANHTLAGTCTAVDAFFLHGSKPNKDYATDPYVETGQRALNYIITNMSAPAVSPQAAGNPDYNRNGVGIVIGPTTGEAMYPNGICGVAFASSGTPNRQAQHGASNLIRGRTFKDLSQDLAEWFAFGQNEPSAGNFRGGWYYTGNTSSADGSTNQWPMLTIAAAEDNMAIKTPTFVRTEAPYFMSFSRHAAKDNQNGGWGYNNSTTYVNHAKTAAGMLYHYFEGNSTSHPEVQAALGFFYRYWSLNSYDGGGAWNTGIGNSYAMYGIMKAMRKPQPNILRITEYNYNTNQQTANSFDWYYTPPGQTQVGLATDLVRRQAANGSWSDSVGNNAQSGAFATGWDVLILSKGVTTIPPEAEICDCSLTWDNNQNITLDGSCSNHPDLNRAITSYEWDFDYQNNTFTTDTTGVQGTKVGGYQVYGNHPVALRVTDNNPAALGGAQTSLATCTIVTKPPNNCPHPVAGGPYLGSRDLPVQLSATASSDPDGDALTYAWDFDNDGQFDDAVGATPTITFAAAGTFTLAVQVTDIRNDGGLTTPCARVAYTTVEIGNHAPVARPTGPFQNTAGTVIQLNGTASSDPDGDSITFAWDLNNDGVFADSTLVTPFYTVPNAPVGTIFSVCLKVTDVFGLASAPACSTVKVVAANSAPICTAPAPAIVGECSGGALTLTVDGMQTSDPDNTPLTYSWSTTCPGGSFANPTAAMTTLTLDTAGGGCAPAPCVAILSVSDGQATTNCQRQINIVDTSAPTFTATPANTTIECNGGTAASVDAWLGGAAASDTCTSVSMANDFVQVAGGCGGATGTSNVTWTATDTCGNTTQKQATLNIVDTTSPALDCPAPVTRECTGVETAIELAATAVDGCAGDLPVVGPASAMYPVGVTPVAFQATDACGNATSCDSSVTVVDTTAPTLECPADLAVECNAAGAATGLAVDTAIGADLCGDVTVTSDAPADGVYALGVTTTTHQAVDAHGNETTCTSTVTVADTTDPTLECPPDLTVECDGQGGAASVDAGQATATDVCSTVTVDDPAVQTYPLGVNAAVHSATDASGNQASCINVVTVVDTTAPVFDAGSLGPRNVLGSCGAAPVSFPLPTATDGCQAVTVTCGAVAGNSLGANTVTCTATDGSGNETTTNLTVNVLAAYRLSSTSLADDNVADDPATDADISNVFKSTGVVPHNMKIFACDGTEVTTTVGKRMTLRLTATRHSGVAGTGDASIVPEYSGYGDAGGVMVLTAGAYGQFRYSLATNTTDYPIGTVYNATYFTSLVTATMNATPGVWVGREDVRLETNNK